MEDEKQEPLGILVTESIGMKEQLPGQKEQPSGGEGDEKAESS